MNIKDKNVAERLRRIADELRDLAEMLESEDESEVADDAEPDEIEPVCESNIKIPLNDRYRFRRELFGNSDAEMTDTLQLIEAMQSADEVTDYLIDDLHWDAADNNVKDFIRVATARFSDRLSLLG